MKYLISLIFIFSCSPLYAQAIGLIRSHNQLTGTGTVNHSTLDTFYNSKGQANGLASLDENGNVVQSAGTTTLPGGYVKQTNGTATGTQLTSVQINSGTGTLSAATIAGIDAPYIKQTNGTGTGLTLSGTNIINGVTAPYISQSNGTGTGITLAGITDLGTTSINVSGTPLIDLAIGDTDTGLKWNSDGNIDLYVNNAYVMNLTPSVAKINDTLYIEGGNANIKVGTTTQDGSAKITSNGLVSVKSGGVKFPDGNTQTDAVLQWVKGIVAGSGISIDNPTGTVTINASGSTGGWTDGTSTVYVTTPADQVIIGSTTSSGRQLTCVGSSTFYGQVAIGSGTTLLGVSAPTLLEMAIGDSDTGLKWDGDGILSLYGNANKEITIDGNTNKTRIGTITASTKLNVGGTVTAEGFSGNGAGLTGIPIAFSTVTGSATASQLPSTIELTGTTTAIATTSTVGRLYTLKTVSNISNGTITFNGGTITADSVLYGAAANAIDGTTSSWWETGDTKPHWIQYQYPTAKIIDIVRLNKYGNELDGFVVKGSNNGSDFTDIFTGTQSVPENTWQTHTFSNGNSYIYYRIHIPNNDYAGIREMEFAEQPSDFELNTLSWIPHGTITPSLKQEYGTASNSIVTYIQGDIVVDKPGRYSTTTAYCAEFSLGKPIIAQAYNLYPCDSEHKDIIDVGSATPQQEAFNVLLNTGIYKFLWETPALERAKPMITELAKVDYGRKDYKQEKELWEEVYKGNYTTDISGSKTVNVKKMEADFEAYYLNKQYFDYDNMSIQEKNELVYEKKKAIASDDPRNKSDNFGIVIDKQCPDVFISNGTPEMSKMIQTVISASKESAERIVKIEAELKALKALINP